MNTNEQKPDAPQEVPDDNKFSSNPHNHGMVPTGEVAGMPGMAEWSPAPSKETIARQCAEEVVASGWVNVLYPTNKTTERGITAIILRALDRAGEAKGVDAEHLRELIKRALTYGLNGSDLYDSHEASKVGQEMRAAVCTVTSAPRPPASVDAGTPRTCPVCNNDGFWVDVQPNRHTGDAEQVQVECEFCAMRNERDLTVARIEEATAQLSSLAVQLEEAKKERDEFVGTMNELSMALLNKKAECARIRESLDGFALSAMDGNGEIGRLKAAIEMLNRDKTEMAEHFDEALIERDAHWTGEYKEAHRQISALRSALAEKEKDYAKLCQANVGLADGAIESLQGVRTLRAHLAALEEDKRRLQTLEDAARDLVVGDHMNIGFDYLLQRCDSMGAGVLKARLLALRSALSSENPRTLREGEEK
jgi:hypothetical protein